MSIVVRAVKKIAMISLLSLEWKVVNEGYGAISYQFDLTFIGEMPTYLRFIK